MRAPPTADLHAGSPGPDVDGAGSPLRRSAPFRRPGLIRPRSGLTSFHGTADVLGESASDPGRTARAGQGGDQPGCS